MTRLFLLAALLLPAGCRTPDKAFVLGTDALWGAIGPEYVSYLNADPSLDEEARKIKLGSAAALTRIIDEAKKSTTEAQP
jgi:hypothetical protein